MSKILTLGVATLDIIHHVDHYPQEDEELRARAQDTQRGGNAANSAVVLAQLGHRLEFAGTLADDAPAQLIKADLHQHGVATRFCTIITGGHTPTSYITLNEQNGSRTIVHYRDLPELTAADVSALPWQEYDWFHLEGRAVAHTADILQQIHSVRIDQPISIEIEKDRQHIDRLFTLADVLLFSRQFVTGRGFNHAHDFFNDLRRQEIRALLICAWGAQGAYARDQHDVTLFAPAQPPPAIIDTRAAGDTFNAAVIDALCSGHTLLTAIQHGCALAGKKIGQQGLSNLV
jgi:ketohexokinase